MPLIYSNKHLFLAPITFHMFLLWDAHRMSCMVDFLSTSQLYNRPSVCISYGSRTEQQPLETASVSLNFCLSVAHIMLPVLLAKASHRAELSNSTGKCPTSWALKVMW